MNYATLKSMIESLIKGYNCPACSASNISEQHIDIVGAAGNTVNIDMKCPSCEKHYMARMEVVGLNLSDAEKFSKGNISNMKLGVDAIKHALKNIKENNKAEFIMESTVETIKDEEIVDLSKNLKNRKLKVEDLFSE